jgi:hypothetical protein
MSPVFEEKASMACVARVGEWVGGLARREAERAGLNRAAALRVIARRASLSPGTVEGLDRRRVKHVRDDVRDAIRQLVVAELEQELLIRSHELHLLKQMGERRTTPDFSDVERALGQAKALLRQIAF